VNNEKKIKLLEDVFEVEEGALNPNLDLDSMDNWDSMTKLALIVMIEEEYGKILSSDKIRAFCSVGDIMQIME